MLYDLIDLIICWLLFFSFLQANNDNASDDDTISKISDTSSNRCTVKKWLENSDLNNREESADIIKAICEVREKREKHFLLILCQIKF